jgi:signal peptide peptidase SppA
MHYPRVVQWVRSQPWAILLEKLEAICEILAARAEGIVWTAEEIQQRLGAQTARPIRQMTGTVAIVPVFGVIARRMNVISASSGGTSIEQLAGGFRAAQADPQVQAILLDVDSEGGTVYGVPELAAEIFAVRGSKPIVAVANSTMASAAYWIASAADEIVVSPSAEVGSIGVYGIHTDRSKADEQAGVKTTIISAGAYKAEGNPYEPLTDEARAYAQARVDEMYNLFVKDVARGRGVTPAAVREGYGQGRLVGAKQAVALGLADRLGTYDETMTRLAKGWRPARLAAETADLDLRARRLRRLVEI